MPAVGRPGRAFAAFAARYVSHERDRANRAPSAVGRNSENLIDAFAESGRIGAQDRDVDRAAVGRPAWTDRTDPAVEQLADRAGLHVHHRQLGVGQSADAGERKLSSVGGPRGSHLRRGRARQAAFRACCEIADEHVEGSLAVRRIRHSPAVRRPRRVGVIMRIIGDPHGPCASPRDPDVAERREHELLTIGREPWANDAERAAGDGAIEVAGAWRVAWLRDCEIRLKRDDVCRSGR